MNSSFDEELPAIFNDSSLLQFAIFCIVWPALELLEQGSRISINVTGKDQSVEIAIKLDGKMERIENDTPWEDMLPEVLQILEAKLSRRIDQDGNEKVVVAVSSIESTYSQNT